MARIAGRFGRVEPRAAARSYLLGLLTGVERKNCWQLAERAGHKRPGPLQRLLRYARWDADAVRDDLRSYAAEHLGTDDAVAPKTVRLAMECSFLVHALQLRVPCQTPLMRRCGGVTRQGRMCGNPAGRSGYCHLHGGGRRSPSADVSPSRIAVGRELQRRRRGWWWRLRWLLMGLFEVLRDLIRRRR
ncbi:transposase [Streptomyces albidoflavus]